MKGVYCGPPPQTNLTWDLRNTFDRLIADQIPPAITSFWAGKFRRLSALSEVPLENLYFTSINKTAVIYVRKLPTPLTLHSYRRHSDTWVPCWFSPGRPSTPAGRAGGHAARCSPSRAVCADSSSCTRCTRDRTHTWKAKNQGRELTSIQNSQLATKEQLLSPVYTCDFQCDFRCNFAYKTCPSLPRTGSSPCKAATKPRQVSVTKLDRGVSSTNMW